MPLSNYRHGFPNNVTIREFPILEIQNGNGHVWWVDSNKGSDGNKGTFDRPFATLDYAIGRCTANNGDKIFVAASHAENLIEAGTVTADIAGIQIIGLGTGDERPTFTATTDVAASFLISANDIYIANLKFKCDIASQTAMIDINAARVIIDGCRFEEGAETGLAFVDINGGAVNTCDGVQILNSGFYMPTAGNGDCAIELGEVADSVIISGNYIWGDFDDAGIHNPTGKVLTNLRIENNIVGNLQTGDHAIELVSGCTGHCVGNRMYGDTEAAILDPGNLVCLDNMGIDAYDAGAFTLPAPADSASNYIGVNSNNNEATTNLVTANSDGSVLERLEHLKAQIIPDLGGLVFSGTCDTGMTGSTTTIVCADLTGYGDDYFNDKYYMQVVLNADSVGAAPELQVRKVTDYVSATGTFTTDAFGANVQEADKIMVMHESTIAIGRNDADNAFDSSSVVSNADGSVLERLEHLKAQIIPDLGGLVFSGTCDSGMTGSTTSIVCADLAGYGDDFFNTKYWMQVIKNTNSVGNTPEMQVRSITDYVSATGTFTTAAFGANVEETDEIMIIHESQIMVGRDDADNAISTTNVVANADGSVLERQEYLQTKLIPDVTGLVYSGVCDTGMTASTQTIVCGDLKGYGDDIFNTKYYMQILKNSNSVGNAPESEIRKITDYGSGTGTFTCLAFTTDVEENDSVLILHESIVATGRDDADNAFDTTLVTGNKDGSILERLEYAQSLSGQVITVRKTLVSSNIPEDGVDTVDVTGAATGDLIIEDVSMNTDGTGLAAGTNFQLEISGNDYGTAGAIFAETVANLGANATVSAQKASVSELDGAVLETGSKLVACSTGAACTGNGIIELQIQLRRTTAGATVAAA